jgi:2-C-methyl-D-erythritol 4-phosphate cytidylyltransferase
MYEVSVIITAGGKGKRMGSSLPKQFMLIKDRPLLMHTIQRFYMYNPKWQLLVTLPEEWVNYWEELVVKYDFQIPHRIVTGGSERYHSIKNALEKCQGKIIAVHDGVRPMVSNDTIDHCFQAMKTRKAVVPVLQHKESIRSVSSGASRAEDRSRFRLVQTPQFFDAEVLMNAYTRPYGPEVTDDACLVEELGETVYLVKGNEENIKVTTKIDLVIAEHLL